MKIFNSLLLAASAAFALAGCPSAPQVKNAGSILTTELDKDGKPIRTVEERTDYAQYLKTFEGQNINVSAKLVEMDCGATDCVFKGKLTIYAPANNAAPHATPQLPPVQESDGWKIMREVKELALGIAPWGFGSSILKSAFKAASQPVTTTTNTTTNTAVSATGAGSSAAAGGSSSGSYSAPTSTTTNTTTTTTTDSNNITRTCNSAQGGNGGTGTTAGGAGAASGSPTC